VQLAGGVGAGDLLEEGEELLVTVPRPAGRGDLRIGRIGAVRSSAWIWLFSSIDRTIASSGGAR